MPDFGLGRGPNFEAGLACAEAKIGLFPEEEEARLQKADFFGD